MEGHGPLRVVTYLLTVTHLMLCRLCQPTCLSIESDLHKSTTDSIFFGGWSSSAQQWQGSACFTGTGVTNTAALQRFSRIDAPARRGLTDYALQQSQ